MPPILWLDEIREGDRARVGGKAFVLALLKRAGLPVPDGFVLQAGATLDEAAREALLTAYGRLGGAVAVRSSSTAEDLAAASFAGQYRTLLDVRGESALLEATAAVLAAAGDGSGYARALGAPDTGAMAVLVQSFVEPRAAGVVFTRHPQDPARLLIESHAGRGEALVSGRLTPDRYVLDRATGALRPGAGGGDSLEAAERSAIALLARRVEEILGAAQDVEWALAAEGPVLLQARPITVDAETGIDPRLRRLSRANVGEVLPDPVTPLTWTTLAAFLEHAFRTITAATGLMAGDPPPFLALYRQRLYLNLSLCIEVATHLPGISAADAERLILGGGATGHARLSATSLPRLLRVGLGLLRLAGELPRQIVAAEERVARLPGQGAIAAADCGGLARLLREWSETGRSLAGTHVATSGASAFQLALLTRLVASVPGEATDRVNRLVAGLDDVASASPATALEALAEELGPRASTLALEDAPRALERFLARFGHRGLSEGELRAPSWEDDPAPLVAALHTLGGARHAAGFRRRARAEVRRADEEALLARLGPVRRAVLGGVLLGAQRWLRERERTKSAAVAMMHHGRRLARAAARALVTGGKLPEADDVFFLTFDELIAALDGAAIPPALTGRRRRRHAREGALPAPREVDLAAPEPATAAPEADVSGQGRALRGIGVSAGVGLGPARVVDGRETPHLEPGEVLVAPVLDAALGPLLARAAGAVAEIGGMLSHGSVVARELGVPCVVDVRDATRRIRTGERVLVDGSAGRVDVVPEQSAASGPTGPPSLLAPADPADEAFHALESHAEGRESVYLNLQDPTRGLAIVASLGVRRRARGEALLAIVLPDGRILFGVELGRPQPLASGLAVGGAGVGWQPVRFRYQGRLAAHEGEGFPPPLVPLALAPRTVLVSLDVVFVPTTPAVDFCSSLAPDILEHLAPLGRHHVEQSGRWLGRLTVDERPVDIDGSGSRDHSWGRRDWESADYWRLFTLRLGADLAVHALSVSVNGHLVEGGFLLRAGRLERVTRVEYAAERAAGRLRAVELDVATAAGPPLEIKGVVQRSVIVPVDLERRRPLRLLGRRPYRLLLHENFTRYEALGLVGYGMAEFTQRPL